MKTKLAILLISLLHTIVTQGQYLKVYQDFNGKYGYKNEKDQIVVPAKYDFGAPMLSGLAVVNTGGKKVGFGYEGGNWAYLDETGKELINLGTEFYKAHSFDKDRAMVIKMINSNKTLFYIDKKGKIITETAQQNYNNGYYTGELTSDLSPGGNTIKYGYRHGKGTYTWTTGEKFEGQWKYGKRSGYGKFTAADGTITEGEWGNDILTNGNTISIYLTLPGAVTAAYPNGKYEGQMLHGIRNGSGKFTGTNGSGYEGKWINGQPTKGKFTFTSGATYEGKLKNNQPDSVGKLTLKDGTTYNGNFISGKLSKTYSNRTFRVGDLKQYSSIRWSDGRAFYIKGWKTNTKGVSEVVLSYHNITVDPNLEVQLIREDNSYFKKFGGFVEVVEPGKTLEKSSTYGYHDSKKSGNVVVTNTTKTYVPGQVRKVPREGYDKFGYKWFDVLSSSEIPAQIFTEFIPIPNLGETFSETGNPKSITPSSTANKNGLLFTTVLNGKELLWDYKGETQNGQANGFGEATANNSSSYKGQWKNNLYHGNGELNIVNSFWYLGEFKNGLRHGKGSHRSGNTRYKGEWSEGLYHGKGTLRYSDIGDFGEYEGEWHNGKRSGKGFGTILVRVPIKGKTSFHNAFGYYLGEWKEDKIHGKGKLIRRERDTQKEKGNTYLLEEGLFEEGIFKSGNTKKINEKESKTLCDKFRIEAKTISGY